VQATDGSTSVRTVEIGVQGDSLTEITSGLTAGETVVVSVDTEVGTTTTSEQRGGFPDSGSFPGGVPGGNSGFTGGQMPGGN